jgi:hypothetical protein
VSADRSSSESSGDGEEQTGRRQSDTGSSAGDAEERRIARHTILDRVLLESEGVPIGARAADDLIELLRESALGVDSGSGGSDLPSSSTPGSPSRGSRTRWSRPSSAALLAAQANDVATRVLNGEIDLDVAARYASTARVAVSAMNIEVQRARAARQSPNLLLDSPVDRDET